MVAMKPTEPVSPQEIYQVLCDAASQDPNAVQSSSKSLQEFRDRPGTYEQLHSIAAEKANVPLNVRQMAIIQFKNGALGVWKNKRLFNAALHDRIRTRSISFLSEEDNIIGDCNAIIVAKIARSDYPSQWPSLVPDLAAIIQTQVGAFLSNPAAFDPASRLLLKRTLRVLDHVIKEFCSVKMPAGIKVMAGIADSLYAPLISYYDSLSSLLQSSFTVTSLLNLSLQRTCEDIAELAHMVFKPCTKIMLWLWQKTSQAQFTSALETNNFVEVEISPSSRSTPTSIPVLSTKSIEHLTRHLRLYGKMFRRMQQLSVKRFVELPNANDLVLYYWGEVVKAASGPSDMISDASEAVYPVRLLVQGMVLFRESLNVWSGKGDPNKMSEVLSKEFVDEAVKLLLTRFIPLAPGDLEKWSIDPEEWVNEEEKENDAWEYELRPCGERVLMTLCNQYHIYVVPLLLSTLQQVLGKVHTAPTHDLNGILQKEATYCAIGRCAGKLDRELDFDEWLQKHLIPEAQEVNPDYRIVKRRIAWVVGRWHADESRSTSKLQVWSLLRHLIQDRGPSTDSVVRLSAAEALKTCVDTVKFDVDAFAPFIGDFVTQLIQLLAEADTWESKSRLANTLNIVIECVGSRITPFMEFLVNPLPQLWQASTTEEDAGQSYLFKASLVVMMTRLIEATGEHSDAIAHVIISLLQECFSSKVKVVLDDDGALLWLAAIRNTTTLESTRSGAPGYIDMFPHAIFLISDNFDLLGSILKVVESYIILNSRLILSKYALQLFQAFVSALLGTTITIRNDIILVINLLTQMAPPSLWAEAMHTSGLFGILTKAVIDDKDGASFLAEHIYIFSRIAIADPLILNELVISAAPAMKMPETQIFEGLLDQWWKKFDSMGQPQHRKLTAMGIASWASTGRPEVLDRLTTEIFNLWLDVFGELKEALAEAGPEANRSPLSLFWRNSMKEPPYLISEDIINSPEAGRRRQIYNNDPVNTTKLTVFVREKLQQAEMACGGTDVFRVNFLDKADPDVLKQLMAALITGT
ncbi:ARM repeat-containing protein [Hysterangium stoloniferum]|nr:ARM repeat-containing protein [Hysterangium stoloniferum]